MAVGAEVGVGTGVAVGAEVGVGTGAAVGTGVAVGASVGGGGGVELEQANSAAIAKKIAKYNSFDMETVLLEVRIPT